MSAGLIRAVVVVVCAGAAGVGCELFVQLDRSAVDAGEAGCPTCSDGGDEGGDAATMASDAGVETSKVDSGADSGG
jgi:hypothetical protein